EEDPLRREAEAAGGKLVGDGRGFHDAEVGGSEHEVEVLQDAVSREVVVDAVGGVGQKRDGYAATGGADEREHGGVDFAAVGAQRGDGRRGVGAVVAGQVVGDGGSPLVVGEDAELGELVFGDPVGQLQRSDGEPGEPFAVAGADVAPVPDQAV